MGNKNQSRTRRQRSQRRQRRQRRRREQVERIRQEEVDNAKALYKELAEGGSADEVKIRLLAVQQIDKYRVDLDAYLSNYDYVKAPSDEGWSVGLTPVDFYMAMILIEGGFDIFDDAYDIIKMLLDAGSIPVPGRGLGRTSGSEFDDDPADKKKYNQIARLLKDRRDTYKRNTSKKALAMSKMLSDRLGEASSAAAAGNISDVLYLVSEALITAEVGERDVKDVKGSLLYKKGTKTKRKKKKTK